MGAVVIVFWYEGPAWGLAFLLATACVMPAAVFAALRLWPYTPIGRRILNLPPGEAEAIAGGPDYREKQVLVGQQGLAKSKMLPSGSVLIGGQHYDAVSESGPIAAGEPVEVVRVDGNRMLVRQRLATETSLTESGDFEDPFAP